MRSLLPLLLEPSMYFAIGFLLAALLSLPLMGAIHRRAARLTSRHLDSRLPLSVDELRAEKDLLRSDFAVATTRLQSTLDDTRAKFAAQSVEIGRQGTAVASLKTALGEKAQTIAAIEAREAALKERLRETEHEHAAKAISLDDARRALAGKEAELARLSTAIDDRELVTDHQGLELARARVNVEALKATVVELNREVDGLSERLAHARGESETATRELADERGKVENLGRRVGELEQHLAAQTTEAEILGRRAHDLETRLGEQSRLLTQSEFELKQVRGEIETARKTEGDLRSAIAELDGRANSTGEKLKAERDQLQAELDRTRSERDGLARELGTMKRETEENWASERVENALLRERINDVAAEVARLASALEGPNSPIDAILAAETVRDRVAVTSNGETKHAEAISSNGDLADRIRALQTHASRIQHSDKPQ
jgi:chromosome segregation ATPase